MFNDGDFLTVAVDGKVYNGKIEIKDGIINLTNVLCGERGDAFARKIDEGEKVKSHFLVINYVTTD